LNNLFYFIVWIACGIPAAADENEHEYKVDEDSVDRG
jgi:hypothetical protein